MQRVTAGSVGLCGVIAVSLGLLPIRNASATRLPPPASHRAHAIHLTYTRITIDKASVVCHVRLFRDDLQQVLRSRSANTSLAISDSQHADSLVTAYFAERFTLTADGTPLHGAVVASGSEHEVAGQEMVWYDVRLVAKTPLHRLLLRNAMLFEAFPDEQNLVSVTAARGAVRHTYNFTVSEDKVEELRL